MAATPIILVGEWVEPDGSPSAGSVKASLTVPVSNNGVSYEGATRFAFLDSSGSLALPVIANDDVATLPGDSQWYVEVVVVGAPTVAGYVSIPSDPPGSRSVSDAVLVQGSLVVTSATANFTSADIGTYLYASGLPVGSRIVSVQSTTSATLTNPALQSGTGERLLIGASVPLSLVFPA